MKYEEFFLLLFGVDFKFLTLTFLIFFISIFLIFRKNINNLFDPINIMIINLSSVFTILMYLFFENKIKKEYFSQLLCINLIFLFFFKVFISNKKKIFLLKKKINKKFFKIYYFIHTFLFFLTTLIFIKFVGNKLLVDKLNGFNNLGLINYASTFLFPGQLILIFIKREIYDYRNKIDYLICFFIFILFLFSGGKTATISYFLYIFSIFYFFNLIKKNKKYEKIKKYSFFIFITSFIGVLILFKVLMNETGILKILKSLLYRILNTGDVYYLAYVDNVLEKIRGISLFEYYMLPLINPILKRITSVEEFLYPGFQIREAIYGFTNKTQGPNTRYDLVLQMNLGYLGIIGGMLSGFLMGVIRKIKTLNFIFLEVIIILFVNFEAIIIDFAIFGRYLFSCIFMLSILVPISYFIYKILGSYKK